MKATLLILFISLGLSPAIAQSGKPRGFFVQDTAYLGKPVEYVLYYHHNREEQLLFPDTNYNFQPFELVSRNYYPTHTADEHSLDSVVYHLHTFSLDTIQYLALPVNLLVDGDTIPFFPERDSVILFRQLNTETEDVVLKANQQLEVIEDNFNYYYLSAWCIGILLFIGILFLTLGKTFVRRYRLLQIRSAHMNFIRAYEQILRQFVQEPNPNTIELALSMWKEYLGKLEEKPINTFTTTEIITLYNREDLMLNLQVIDRSIYGGVITEDVNSALSFLKSFSNRKYLERKKEVNLG